MTVARKTLVSLVTTEHYHCISRCVRRAFLCGKDEYSDICYEHRRQWLEDRMLLLAQFFAIDIAAYAIMSNHYHIVLHVNRTKAKQWSDREVVQQWHGIFSGTSISNKFLSGRLADAGEMAALQKLVACWRERLMDISWFMRSLNEPIAHLNPIRANMAETPESSEHTSIQRRIGALYRKFGNNQPEGLMPFSGSMPLAQETYSSASGLPFDFPMYLDLVESTGRIVRGDKAGAISTNAGHILDRLKITQEHWIYLAENFHSPFKNLVGCYHQLKHAYQQLGLKRTLGEKACVLYFGV